MEKPEEDGDFLPRKLFFFGFDTFDIQPKVYSYKKFKKIECQINHSNLKQI